MSAALPYISFGTIHALLRVDRVTWLRIAFCDKGPGIPDVQLALTDGYTSGGGLGHGLGGARRLVDDFDIRTAVGQGTTVTIARWKK